MASCLPLNLTSCKSNCIYVLFGRSAGEVMSLSGFEKLNMRLTGLFVMFMAHSRKNLAVDFDASVSVKTWP